MAKVSTKHIVVIELKDGCKVELSLDEARKLHADLGIMIAVDPLSQPIPAQPWPWSPTPIVGPGLITVDDKTNWSDLNIPTGVKVIC